MNTGRIQMRAILQTLPELIPALQSTEAREAIVFAVWPTIIGEQLREKSAPIGLENKTLAVAVPCREWKREFQLHAGNIVYKLNAALKNSIVDRLEFVIDPVVLENSRIAQKRPSGEQSSARPISKDVSVAASHIADSELRLNFLKAAAACIERRDTADK
jgi:hypothetical protein